MFLFRIVYKGLSISVEHVQFVKRSRRSGSRSLVSYEGLDEQRQLVSSMEVGFQDRALDDGPLLAHFLRRDSEVEFKGTNQRENESFHLDKREAIANAESC